MIALVDCNNFFVSCELTRHPELVGRPVVVAGHNGGCVVAMSNEAKRIGVTRGVPLFKIRDLVEREGIVDLPCDHHFYKVVSERVMRVIADNTLGAEIYSVDEAFFQIPMTGNDALEFGRHIAEMIKQECGIPVSVGISTTKTLAKIAARFAKKYSGYKGTCLMDTPDKITKGLQLTEIGDVWGIGRRLRRYFENIGLTTAWEFASWSETDVKRRFGVTLERTWREINGEAVLDADSHHRTYSTMAYTRTFAHDCHEMDQLDPEIARYAESLGKELRKHHRLAVAIHVFLDTNRYKPDAPQLYTEETAQFSTATNDTLLITSEARRLLNKIYRRGYGFKRMGLTIIKTISDEARQSSLFDDVDTRHRREKLMTAIDRINAQNGLKSMIKIAATTPGKRKTDKE